MDVVFIDSKFITEETWRKVKARSRSVIKHSEQSLYIHCNMCFFFFVLCIALLYLSAS